MLKMFDFLCPLGHKFEALVEEGEMPICPECDNQAVEKCWASPKYQEDIISYVNNKLGRPCGLKGRAPYRKMGMKKRVKEIRTLDIESEGNLGWIEVDEFQEDVSITLWENGSSKPITTVFPDTEGIGEAFIIPYLEPLIAGLPKGDGWNEAIDWLFEHSKNRRFYVEQFKIK